MGDEKGIRGESKKSFADAARIAVHEAEKEHHGEGEREYEITLGARGKPGSSLSDYIAWAKTHD